MKKRQIVFVALVFLLYFGGAETLFAGGGGQQQVPAKPKLTMLFSAGGSGNSLKSAADLFGSRNGVEIEALLFSLTEVYEKEVLALTSQQETPDVVSIDDTWLPVMKDFLQELSFSNDYYSNFIPSMLNTFRWPQGSTGKHYGIPVRMGGDVIAYREDVLKAANSGPMSLKTWEDIYEAGKKLTNKDQNVYAWVQGYSEPALIVTQWLNFISSYGQKVFNDDMTAFTFNTPLGIEATQMFVNLARDGATPGILR